MLKKVAAFVFVAMLFSSLFAKDFSQVKAGDKKDSVIKKVGTPSRTFSDGDNEYDIWIDGSKIWLVSFAKGIVDTEPSEIEEMFNALLEMKTAFSALGDAFDSISETVSETKSAVALPVENEDIINKIELTVVECKIYESWSGDNKLGYRIKLKNRSEKEITELEVVTYYRDKEGNIFFEDTVHPVSSYKSTKLKPNYSLFYPESSNSYHPISGIDLEEWDGGKVDFVITSVKTK